MRKIALIMDGWKRLFTFAWPDGILKRLHETEEKVNLYIFNSTGNWSRDKDYNAGEYNIFRLPDFREFDGIILELNNISSPEVLREVAKRAGEAGIPVISIANELKDFYYVGIDNYSAMKGIISHLHQEHGCRKFYFIMGPEDNYESRRRTQAVKDYMGEHQLPFSEEEFYHGGFDYQTGVRGFKRLHEIHGEEKPDAIICANDNIAVGVCETAAEYGYRVPEDFCVTGFDNFDKAGYYIPSITTVGHIREEAGYRCADILLRLWAGEEIPRFNYTETKAVLQESCGCRGDTDRNVREYLKSQIIYGIDSEEFDAEVLSLESEMIQCNTVEEMMYCIPQCIPSLKCEAMYLVLDEHINEFKSEPENYNRYELMSDEGFCTKGYPASMQVRFAYEKDRKLDLEHRNITGIFPMFDNAEGGKDFLFLPLHFGRHTVGYFVIQNAVYLMDKQYLFQIINALNGAMENLHKKEKLEYMNRKLSGLYMMDPLTGMYNRMGYQKLADNYFRIMAEGGKRMLILFIDLDRLKYINDNYGHEYGDYAICAVARAIMKYCDKDAVPARTGGDEFVLVQSYASADKLETLVGNIRANLQKTAVQMELPFELGISVGSAVTHPKESLQLADYVKIADQRMYAEKERKKVRREK